MSVLSTSYPINILTGILRKTLLSVKTIPKENDSFIGYVASAKNSIVVELRLRLRNPIQPISIAVSILFW